MPGISMRDRGRAGSDPSSGDGAPPSNHPPTHTHPRHASDGQQTHSSQSRGSFSRLFGSSELRRTESETISSLPTSVGGSFGLYSSPTASFGSTPLRSRASSFAHRKTSLGAVGTYREDRSLPSAVTSKAQSFGSDQACLQSPAACFGTAEPHTAEERTSPTSTSPAVTSETLPSEQARLYPHSPVDSLGPSDQEQSSERDFDPQDYFDLQQNLTRLDSFFASPSPPDIAPLFFYPARAFPLLPDPIDSIPEVAEGTGRVLDKITDFRSHFGHKRERKAAKEGYSKPIRPDVLDKDQTSKLTKFWDLTESPGQSSAGAEQPSSSPLPTVSGLLAASRAQPTPPHKSFEFSARCPGLPGFHPHLGSISEAAHKPSSFLASGFFRKKPKMDTSLLTPGSRALADQEDKQKRVKDAKEMYQTIVRNCERSKAAVPPFEFLELIGKGAFGRVYKCVDKTTGNLVAIKITGVEDIDFDETVRDFQKEVSTLQQLKANNVKNVNVIHDAFDLHSQLWIVADYCTGGSIRTLMRAFEKNGKPTGLPEHFIITIARELAIALKGMHDMQIIHRDIKCANVYITEDGDIQLGDFGIVGVMDDGNAKRRTVIGTPHYMSKELLDGMQSEDPKMPEGSGYGTEVDIWAYGITICEMATGRPPNSHVFHGEDISRTLEERGPPRLEGADYSPELCDLVAFCLKSDPKARPTAEDILKHPAIFNTSKKYPTSSLVKVIERFKIWEHGGGSRASLWMAAPSDAAKGIASDDDDQQSKDDDGDIDDWNFSTSDDFDKRFSTMPGGFDSDLSFLQAPEGAGMPPGLPSLNTQDLSIAERIKREHSELSANRGERSLARVFNTEDDDGYKLSSPPAPEPQSAPPPPQSDLPLRNFTSNAPTRESMIEIDLNEADVNETATSTFALHMDAINENTIKPSGRRATRDDDDDDDYQYGQQQEDTSKRDTMAWTFPSAATPAPAPAPAAAQQAKRDTMAWTFSTAEPAQPEEPEYSMDLPPIGSGDDLPPGFRPNVQHTSTEPIGHFRDFSHDMGSHVTSPVRDSMASMIDLDMGLADPPRHLDDPADIVRPSTASSATGSTMTDMTSGNPFDLEEDPVQNEIDRNRFSYHKQWQSEGGRTRNSLKDLHMHARGSSLSSNDSDMDLHMAAVHEPLGDPRRRPSMVAAGYGPPEDANQWPSFDSFDSYDTSPRFGLNEVPSMGDVRFPSNALRANGMGRSRDPSTEPHGPEVDFPDIQPPDPNALAEDADPQLLENELGHSINDLLTALSGMETSLRQYANIDEYENDMTSDLDNGFESTHEGTEDEGTADHLTARRTKPRSRSPHMSQADNSFQ